jgi:hypothetical protein
MKQKTQVYLLTGLLGLLLAVLLVNRQGPSPLSGAFGDEEQYVAIVVKDPALRIDRLERIRKLAYPGMKRNLFSGELPPPPHPPTPPPVTPDVPAPVVEAEIVLPFKFYGLAVDPRSGKRRAFFTNGEDVLIASEGDTLMTRYRLLRIGNTSADFEEIGTGRHKTLPLEQPAQPPQG